MLYKCECVQNKINEIKWKSNLYQWIVYWIESYKLYENSALAAQMYAAQLSTQQQNMYVDREWEKKIDV